MECLHTFCHECIVKSVQPGRGANNVCPTCGIKLGNNPFVEKKVVKDQVKVSIVDKLRASGVLVGSGGGCARTGARTGGGTGGGTGGIGARTGGTGGGPVAQQSRRLSSPRRRQRSPRRERIIDDASIETCHDEWRRGRVVTNPQ